MHGLKRVVLAASLLACAGVSAQDDDAGVGIEWTPNCNERTAADVIASYHAVFGANVTCSYEPAAQQKTWKCQVTNQGNRRIEGDVVRRGTGYSHVWWYRERNNDNVWLPIVATEHCVCGQGCATIRNPPF